MDNSIKTFVYLFGGIGVLMFVLCAVGVIKRVLGLALLGGGLIYWLTQRNKQPQQPKPQQFQQPQQPQINNLQAPTYANAPQDNNAATWRDVNS